jgi:uncharacterized protein
LAFRQESGATSATTAMSVKRLLRQSWAATSAGGITRRRNLASAWRVQMPNPKYTAYEAAAPYFDLVRGALGELVDGEHFFDIVADDVIYEVLYDFPGWPRVIRGRADLMARFKGYGDNIELQSADRLITHKTDNDRVVVIEYEVDGTILATGMKYSNRFCSIIKIENRRIAHWRDYMDSLAAWNALTAH